jgi:protein-S-isoprenylcysteine O-methyltransferase Ste14
MWINAYPGEPIEVSAASRIGSVVYGVVCYAIFFATFCYAAGFVGGFLVPTTLDGPRTGPLWVAIAINIGLVLLFGVQHSVMARPWFKAWWTKYVPEHLERSTYVLFSSLALVAMFVLWRPMGGVVWDLHHPVARGAAYAMFAAGWLLVLTTTFLINHFDLFGLRQVWMRFRGRSYTHLRFATPGPYRVVRHPLYVGWLLGFWATPTMTAAHLLFAVLTTVYILAAIRWEERDLVAHHGEDYRRYRARVPMLVPVPGKAWSEEPERAPAIA